MAVRDRQVGLRGPIARWVSADEAQALAAEVSGIRTLGDLLAWCEASPDGRYALGCYRARLGFDDELVDHPRVIVELLADLASRRRHDAISGYAREHRVSLPAALGTDESGRSLARCPACDGPLNLGHDRDFYCLDHIAERDDEALALLTEGGR